MFFPSLLPSPKALSFLAAIGLGIFSAPVALATGDLPSFTSTTQAATCGECHQAQFEQWATGSNTDLMEVPLHEGGEAKGSLHSLALQNDHFYSHFENQGDQIMCLRCHLPESIYTTEPVHGVVAPHPRRQHDENGLEGVTCVSCHLDTEGQIRGPHSYDPIEGVEDHAVLADSGTFDGVGVCASCHGDPFFGALTDTVREWERQSTFDETCVDCHMSGMDGDEKANHTFIGGHSPTLVTRALDVYIDVDRIENSKHLWYTLRNDAAGHLLPTGDLFRAYQITVEVYEDHQPDGLPVRSLERWLAGRFVTPISWEVDTYERLDPLAPGEQHTFGLPVEGLETGAYRVETTVTWWLLKPTKMRVVGRDDDVIEPGVGDTVLWQDVRGFSIL